MPHVLHSLVLPPPPQSFGAFRLLQVARALNQNAPTLHTVERGYGLTPEQMFLREFNWRLTQEELEGGLEIYDRTVRSVRPSPAVVGLCKKLIGWCSALGVLLRHECKAHVGVPVPSIYVWERSSCHLRNGLWAGCFRGFVPSFSLLAQRGLGAPRGLGWGVELLLSSWLAHTARGLG